MQGADSTKLGSTLLYGAYALERGATCTSCTFPTYAERTTIRARTANQVFRVIHKDSNVGIVALLNFENKSDTVISHVNFNLTCHDTNMNFP